MNTSNSISIKGTIKSAKCKKALFSGNNQCHECKGLLQIDSFRKRISRSCKSTTHLDQNSQKQKACCLEKKNHRYLKGSEKLRKFKYYRSIIKKQQRKIFNLTLQLARSKKSKQKIQDKIGELAERGDISAICYNLNLAYEKGCLSGKTKLLKFLTNIAQNLRRKSKGHRYNDFTRQLYDALKITGGARAASLLAHNLEGMSRSSMHRSKKKHTFKFYPDKPSRRTFEHLAKLYSGIKSDKNVKGPVLCETAEDETVIIGKCEWDRAKDECWGWCGVEGENHQCDPAFVHVIGDDNQAYQRLVDAFRQNRVAGFARVIMINPVHIDLPAFVVLLQATCNKFTHVNVLRQWNMVKELYSEYLLPVIGPLVGQASDGDSRRRKLHLINATSVDGIRYCLDHENFTYSAKRSETGAIENLFDQDFIHNAKKLVNHLKHPSRVLSLGGNLCHMNHLELLLANADINQFHHGLQVSDVERRDRMNWESAQRVLFPRVRDCLRRIDNGDAQPQENVSGTLAYLLICWKYVEMFYSLEANLLNRIKYASHVVNFLRIWRNWVYRTGNLNLKHNFVSRETYQDISLSCHHLVLFIMASRDFAPDHPACLSKLGTDCCEEYFSANGSFIINKHNYTITDMYRNLGNMNRLQQIFADEEGPDNPKRHRKGENIWAKGNNWPVGVEPPDMKDFPDDQSIIKYWQLGLQEAQEQLRTLGIRPESNDMDVKRNDWFFYPHRINATTEQGMYQQMWTDLDDIDVAAGIEVEAGDVHEELPQPDCVNLQSVNEDQIVNCTSELGSYLREIANSIEEDILEGDAADTTDTLGGNANSPSDKVKLTVKVPDVGEVHKSTLISMLNSNPSNISTDRLKRVKSGSKYSFQEGTISGNDIGLFDDVAMYVKDKGKEPEYKIARIMRIRNRGRSVVEYRRPVNLDNMEKYPNLWVLTNIYEQHGSTYTYTTSNTNVEFQFSTIILKVSLECTADGKFKLEDSDKKKLDEFLDHVKKPSLQNKRNKSSSASCNQRRQPSRSHAAVEGEGRIVLHDEPNHEQVNDSNEGLRRSGRRRRFIIYEQD